MPLPGGPSDKAGNRYEYLWTAKCMIRVLNGEADSIHLEPAGDEGAGIEFVVGRSFANEHHQVKRQLTGKGVWSLSELDSRGVLSSFYQKLQDADSSCVFTSSHAAHPLDELVRRAKQSSSWEDFEGNFISSNDWSNNFNQLHDRWGSPDRKDTYDRLKRVNVTTIDEDELRESIESGIELLVAGDPSNTLSALLDFASNQVHQAMTATEIWEFLRSRGFDKQQWSREQHVADLILELNQTYLSGTRPVGIGGKIVPRAEVDLILDSFDNPSARTVMISGRAGVGKSAVISQTLQRIQDRGWPMLALRVDRLDPSVTPSELGRSLGLPASPVSVLAAIAEGQDCLLVIDQIDAVSQASGRSPEFFDCISAMLHQAQAHDNMKVLSACRKFDIDNDPRIRDLTKEGGIAEEVPVELFDEKTVKTLATQLGIDPSVFNSRQIELLRVPLHLRLLAETLPGSGTNLSGIQTAKDLFDRFWSFKLAVMRPNTDAAHIQEVADRMVRNMTVRQALSVAAGLLDEYENTVSVMVSENVLVRDEKRVSFFHESFFDYIFARRVTSSGFDLVSYINEQEQSLFIRSQVRQVLLHMRDISTQDFARNLDAILANEWIRPHLKTLVLSLLGSVDNPTEEEWNVVEPVLRSDFARHILGAIYGSSSWFDVLDDLGIIGNWLEKGDEPGINRALWLLTAVQSVRPDRVAELLAPFANSSESWNLRLAEFLTRSDLVASRSFFCFAIDLINAGAVDSMLNPAENGDFFWFPAEKGVKRQPEWICELVAAYWERVLFIANQSSDINEFLLRFDSDSTGEDVIAQAALAAPQKFVEKLLPPVSATVEMYADRSHAPPWRDHVWGHGAFNIDHGLENSLLSALESSLSWIALNDTDEFRTYSAALRGSEYHTTQNLLLRSYAASGKAYSDEAVEFLLEHPEKRLSLDYVSTSSAHAAQLATAAVSPFCSSENFERLEEAILDYYPEWERSAGDRQWRGVSQLKLLTNMEESRLSERSVRRLGELRRKFDSGATAEPRGIEGGWVRSPIPETAAARMSDDQWLGAIRRYSSYRSDNVSAHFLTGGAHELSQLLETQTKENPKRFVNLVHRIPDDSNPAYFEAILRGIEGADLEMETVVQACLRCHGISDRPFGRWITRPLIYFPTSQLPGEALEMVAWYATKHPDPALNSPYRTHYQRGQEIQSYEPLSVGINSVRGSAAGSVARLLAQNEAYLSFFRPHLHSMVQDPSDATRACVAEASLGVLRHDRDFAVELFLELCDADERLLATPHVEAFLKYAVQTHFDQLEPILRRMVESEYEAVAAAGACWVCYASLTVEEAKALSELCVSGSKPQRLGAAKVYAANLKQSAHRSVSWEMLVRLFSDGEAEIRNEAARCFYGFEGRELRDYEQLVEEFILSPSFTPEHNPLFRALENTTANIPTVVLLACERVFELAAGRTGDISTAVAGTSGAIAKLIVREYSRTTDPTLRSRCLDLIDKMSLFGAYGLDVITEEFDR